MSVVTWQVLVGDVREQLATLPDGSVQCVVTSPPYWGLRSYLPTGHDDKPREIGQEPTPDAYVETLVGVFREVRRVLHESGTVFLNLGDSFADKQLQLVPFRVALGLQADGWYLRSVICWAKKSCMPESVTDRPTNAWEPIFLLAKNSRYFYDAEAVKEGSGRIPGNTQQKGAGVKGFEIRGGLLAAQQKPQDTRNQRNVWHLGPEPYPLAHFATFPTEIPRRAILAGTSEKGCCPTCGAPWRRVVEKGEANREQQRRCGGDANGEYNGRSRKGHAAAGVQDASAVKARVLAGMKATNTLNWEPACACGHDPVPCTVLDPFCGSGTTGLVAAMLLRNFIGIDLNQEYSVLAKERIRSAAPLFAEEKVGA